MLNAPEGIWVKPSKVEENACFNWQYFSKFLMVLLVTIIYLPFQFFSSNLLPLPKLRCISLLSRSSSVTMLINDA